MRDKKEKKKSRTEPTVGRGNGKIKRNRKGTRGRVHLSETTDGWKKKRIGLLGSDGEDEPV